MSWGFAAAMAVMAVSVVVDWRRGDGLDLTVAALLPVLLPYAAGELLRAYGREGAAARTDSASRWMTLPAAALLWAGLITGWRRGDGTQWIPLTAAVLMSLGAAVGLLKGLVERRVKQRAAAE